MALEQIETIESVLIEDDVGATMLRVYALGSNGQWYPIVEYRLNREEFFKMYRFPGLFKVSLEARVPHQREGGKKIMGDEMSLGREEVVPS